MQLLHKQSKLVAVAALFPAALLLYVWLCKIDLSLTHLDAIVFSQATSDGVDVGKRVGLFFKGIFGGTLLFLAVIAVFVKLLNLQKITKSSLRALSALSVAGFFLLIADAMLLKSGASIGVLTVAYLLTLGLALIKKSAPWANHPDLLSILFSLGLIGLTILQMLLPKSNPEGGRPEYLFLLVCLLLIAAAFGAARWGKRMPAQWLPYLLPLAFTPLMLFLSIESTFFLRRKFEVNGSPGWLFGGMVMASLLAWGLYRYFVAKQKMGLSTMLQRYFAPGALFSVVLLVYYFPVKGNSEEMFELANSANAMMRSFVFGEVPMIDYMSSHMFSEQFYGYIYHWIFGYDGSLEFTLYKFFYEALFYAVAYVFLQKFFKQAGLSLLFLVCFPFLTLFFYVHLFWAMLVLWLFDAAFEKPGAYRFFALYAAVFALIFWRLDTGAACLMTSVVYFFLRWLTEGKPRIWKALLRGKALFLLLASVLFVAALAMRGGDTIMEHLNVALHYIAGNQAHGYSTLAGSFPQQFFVYHLWIPAFCVLSVLAIVYRLMQREVKKTAADQLVLHSALFLYLLCLFNFQRGLVRHSFVENTEHFLVSTFFIATALSLTYWFNTSRRWRFAAFFSIGFALFAGLKFFPIRQAKPAFERFLSAPTITPLSDTTIYRMPTRIFPNDAFADSRYRKLKAFFDQHLTPEQTFLDFSNTPMLYFYCGRKVPAYFCQSLQNSVDDALQLAHLQDVSPEKTPVVLFSEEPPGGFDASDGIPNVMRYYLIADYIFQHYQPYGVLNSRQVWLAKGLDRAWGLTQKDSLSAPPTIFYYHKTAGFLASYLDTKKPGWLTQLGDGKLLDIASSGVSYEVPEAAKNQAAFLTLEIEQPTSDRVVEVRVMHSDGSVGRFSFETAAGVRRYAIRVSNLYKWYTHPPSRIEVNFPGVDKTLRVSFQKDTRI